MQNVALNSLGYAYFNFNIFAVSTKLYGSYLYHSKGKILALSQELRYENKCNG